MRFAVGFITGVAVTVSCAVVMAQLAGQLSNGLALAALISGGSAGGYAAWRTKAEWFAKPSSAWGWIILSVFAFAVWRSFFFLIYSDGHSLRIQNINNLGDLSKHINYILHLTRAGFWPDNPLIEGGGIHYPFGMDLINALLVLCGLNLYSSLIWVGGLSMVAVWATVYRWGGTFAVAAVLFNGGLLGFLFFGEWTLRDYQSAAEWKNIFLSMLVPQRGFLFALPAGLVLMCSLRELLHAKQLQIPLWVGPLSFMVMPLFHLHTYIFLSGLILFWCVFGPARVRSRIAMHYGIAFLPSVLLAWLVSDGFSGGKAIRWAPGWMAGDGWDGVTFWFVNFGFFLPLFVAVLIISRRNLEQRMWIVPAAALFLLVSLFSFAPWIWDNTKLYLWAYVSVLPVLGYHLRGMHIAPRAGWYAGLFFSGAISLFGSLTQNGAELIKRSELHAATVLLNGLPHEARIACAPSHNHPAYILGYKLAAAYDGHLFGHGLDYRTTHGHLNTLLNGEPGAVDAARELGVSHIFWSNVEKERYSESSLEWKKFARKIRSIGDMHLYQMDYSPGLNSGILP